LVTGAGTVRLWDVRVETGLPSADIPVVPLPRFGTPNVLFFHAALRRAVVWPHAPHRRLVLSVADTLLVVSDAEPSGVARALWDARALVPHPAHDDLTALPEVSEGMLLFDTARMYAPVARQAGAGAGAGAGGGGGGGSSSGGASADHWGPGSGVAAVGAVEAQAVAGPRCTVECLDEPPGATTMSMAFDPSGQLLVTRRVAIERRHAMLHGRHWDADQVGSRPGDEVSVFDLASVHCRGARRVLGWDEARARRLYNPSGDTPSGSRGSSGSSSDSGSDSDSDSGSGSGSGSEGGSRDGLAGTFGGGGCSRECTQCGADGPCGSRLVTVVDRTLFRVADSSAASDYIKGLCPPSFRSLPPPPHTHTYTHTHSLSLRSSHPRAMTPTASVQALDFQDAPASLRRPSMRERGCLACIGECTTWSPPPPPPQPSRQPAQHSHHDPHITATTTTTTTRTQPPPPPHSPAPSCDRA
jgi:hypothetical protein